MGYLVLAHAYVLVIVGIARFQSWQAIIRFGAPMLADAKHKDLQTLIRFAAKLDLFSGAVAVFVATASANIVGGFMGWPSEAMPYIYAYCFVAPFLIAATPTGILRLFDEFKLLGRQLVLMPAIRFVGAITLLLTEPTLVGFLLVWAISAVAHGASLWVLGWRHLKRRDLVPPLSRPSDVKASPDWLPFMIKTNLSSTVDAFMNNAPVLIVGAVLGGAASGFLQIATNLSNLIAHPANMLNEASFPELSKIVTHQGKEKMRAVALRSAVTGAAIATPIVIAFIILRERLAVFVGGPEFAAAAALIGWMALAQTWRIGLIVLQSAVVSLGWAGYVLIVQSVTAIAMTLFLFLVLPQIGVVGAPVAIIAAWSLLVLAYLFALWRFDPSDQKA